MTSERMLLRKQRKTSLKSKGISWFRTSALARKPSFKMKSWLTWTIGIHSLNWIMTRPKTSCSIRACPWKSMPRDSLRRPRRSSFSRPRLTYLRKVWARSSLILRRSVSCLNSKTNRSFVSSTKSSKTSTSLSDRRTKKAQTWSRSVRWSWINVVILSSSSLSPWSKSKKKSEDKWRQRCKPSRATSNPNSCLWSNLVASSPRRTTRASRPQPSLIRRSQLNWMT